MNAARAGQPTVGVVIPAAGAGTRLGGEPKQFRMLAGKPLLIQTAAVFNAHPAISAITIVAAIGKVTEIEALCTRHNLDNVVNIVEGGITRQASVFAGLRTISDSTDIVLTHDAVRPFVRAAEITALIETAMNRQAAVLAAPIADTIARAAGGVVGERIDRDGVYRLLTPQGFQFRVLMEAFQRADQTGEAFTDEVTLVQAAGYDVALVPGSAMNIKITTPDDWHLAQRTWEWWLENR